MESNPLQSELHQAISQGNLWAAGAGLLSLSLLSGTVYVFLINLRRLLRNEERPAAAGAVPVAWNLNFVLPVGLLAFVIIYLFLAGLSFSLPVSAKHSFNFLALSALLQTFIVETGLALSIVLLLRRRYVGIWQLGLDNWRREYLRSGIWAYLSILPGLAVIGALLGLFRKTLLPEQEIYYLLMGLTSLPLSLIFLIIVGVAAPFLEEVIFRGFLFGTMRTYFGPLRSMVYSSLLFAALHQSLVAFLPIFFLAMILAYLYEKTGSLWPSVVLHMVNNGVATVFVILVRQATS